ncbi:MAG TPA: DUF3187 family protein [Dokdonella sp.]|nr:DUF3187 family protein [Dokdonella sp.]
MTFSNPSRWIACALLLVTGHAALADAPPGWLPVRDTNPFALATGLPLTPAVPAPGAWQFDTTISVANTELRQFRGDASLLFDAETHETRLSAIHAINARWSLRASISHLWIGAGFLDRPVERFHSAFGFDNGDRGLLGTHAPQVEVRRGDVVLYALDRGQSGVGPLLLDLTRSWRSGTRGVTGLSLGAKLPTGSRARLGDSGSSDVSFSAFALLPVGERLTVGARAGLLVQGDNRLLGDTARDAVPFASALLRYRFGQKWSAVLQSDAHGPLYRGLPEFLGTAGNQLNFGLIRHTGGAGEFQITLGEDLPALRTSDIAINLTLRLTAGG